LVAIPNDTQRAEIHDLEFDTKKFDTKKLVNDVADLKARRRLF